MEIEHYSDHFHLEFGSRLVYAFNVYEKEHAVTRLAKQENNRIALRIRPAEKALIMRAVALTQSDITDFVLLTALREAQSVIDDHERVKLSGRDSVRVLDLLDDPPAPNAKLRKAARALPKRS